MELPRMKRFPAKGPLLGALLIASAGAGIGVGRALPTGTNTTLPPIPAAPLLKQTSENFRAVAKRVSPAVVVIQAIHDTPPDGIPDQEMPFAPEAEDFEQFFGFPQDPGRAFRFPSPNPPQQGRRDALGSGFLIDKQGDIVTNNHVVQGATKLTVTLSGDDATEIPAKVVGRDPKTDLAVIRLQSKRDLPASAHPALPDGVPVAEWADSDAVEVGDWAVAIGSPFMLTHSVTAGIVSAKGRNASDVMQGSGMGYDLIQTDAAINPGNSGGPLCSLDGKVMGVNTAIYTKSGGYMGIGFAIPSNLAKSVTEQLIRDGHVTRGWMGVAIRKADKTTLKDLGLSEGIVIQSVEAGSPAERAGIRAGDIIAAAKGSPVKNASDLQRLVAESKPGSQLPLEVVSYESKKHRAVQVTLGERPPTPEGVG